MKNIAYYNGKTDAIENMQIPMNDRVCWFGDGVYDVTLSLNRKPYCYDAHVDRFYNSMRLLRIAPPMPKEEFKALVDGLAAKVDSPDQMLYFQATRGVAPRNHAFPDVGPSLWITVKPGGLKPIDRPLRVITVEDRRFSICNIKTLNLILNCMAEQEAVEAGVDTAVFIRDGFVTECAHSNVHIIKDGRIVTHPADQFILPGIARANMIRIAGRLGIPVDERPFTREELFGADEVFMTSTSTVCPRIVEVDGRPAGCAAPEIFFRLQKALLDDLFEATRAD
jgi:D-alanine transaminase